MVSAAVIEEPIAFIAMVTVPAVVLVPATATEVTLAELIAAAAGRFRLALVVPVDRLVSLQAIPKARRDGLAT